MNKIEDKEDICIIYEGRDAIKATITEETKQKTAPEVRRNLIKCLIRF